MGQENSKCSCCASNEDKNTAIFDKDKNQGGVINNNLIISNHQINNKDDNQQSSSETNSFKDLKTYISFKKAIDSANIQVMSPNQNEDNRKDKDLGKEKESNKDQDKESTAEQKPQPLLSTKVKKHTSILVHQGLMKKEVTINDDIKPKAEKISTGKKSKMLGLAKSKSVNPFSGLKKNIVVIGQKIVRGYCYRKKYKKIKQEQIEYTDQLLKDLYCKYMTQKIKDMEISIGIKHDKNSWKTLITQSSLGVGSSFVSELRLFTKLKILSEKEEGFYVGEVNINNQMNGKGILLKSNGSKYDGQWEKNKFNGLGRIIDVDGSLYEGFFTDGKINGKGTKKTLDGTLYVGDFKNHKKEGKGKEESKETTYEGYYANDNKHGKGTLVYKLLNDVYEGNFVDNNISGEGRYRWNNKETYEGTFKGGKMDGRGIFKWADGGEYEGDYVNNIKEGQGRYKWSNGKIYTGSFKRGKPCGEGILFVKGKEYKVQFKDGKIVGKLIEVKKEVMKLRTDEEENENEGGCSRDNDELEFYPKQNISLQDQNKDLSSNDGDYSP